MRVLLLGGDGQVARAVKASAPLDCDVLAKSHADLDIGDVKAVIATLKVSGAEWVINGAAYTAVDLAESESVAARRINETAVGDLAEATSRAGVRLLHLSTDFVFDGMSNRAYLPTDTTNPLSVYGATKLGGEKLVLTQSDTAIILRTAWVYAAVGRNFPLTMLRLLRERDEVRVVSDQIGTPTWASGLAGAIWGLIGVSAPGGVYHWTDLGVASWYDFAVAVQEEALARGLLSRAGSIIPISSALYPTAARRPAFSVLNTESTRSAINFQARHWRHTLRLMLDEFRNA